MLDLDESYVPDRTTYLRHLYSLRGYEYWLREECPLVELARGWAALGSWRDPEHALAEMFLVLREECIAPDDAEKVRLLELVGELYRELKKRITIDDLRNGLSDLDSRARAALGE